MSYVNVSIEPTGNGGEYRAELCGDDGYEDPDMIIENMINARLKVFELGTDNLPASLDIRAAIDIAPGRVFYAVPDEPDARPFCFGIAAQH